MNNIIKKNNIKVMHFSPVGTTKRVAEGIVAGIDQEKIEWIDLCRPENRLEGRHFDKEDIVLMVFPVYAGRVVRIPRYYFKQVSGNGARAVVVVTYGNRAYDDALLELKMLAEKAGFNVMGAAAFVCEHSFGIGLASGRPDEKDLAIAKDFGDYMFLSHKRHDLTGTDNDYWQELNKLPGQYPFRTQFRHDFGGPLLPSTQDTCIDCKKCALDCPVEAIDYENPLETDASKCIICFRCIRRCPVKARSVLLDDFVSHAKWLADEFKERKEAELYR